MANTNENTMFPPPPTPDPLDELMSVIEQHQAMGEVRLSRLNGSVRAPIAQMPADTFDPFTVGEQWGSGRYMAQFVQRGKIIKSATFASHGATPPPTLTPTTPATPATHTADPIMLEILRGMMAQQTALMSAMAQPRHADNASSDILKAVLPALLTRENTPLSLYKQMLEMAREATLGQAAPAPQEESIGSVLKILGSLIPPAPARVQAPATQAPAAFVPTTPQAPPALPDPLSPPKAPEPATPPPETVGSLEANKDQLFKEMIGIDGAPVRRMLTFALEEQFDSFWIADSMILIISKQENPIQLWESIITIDAETATNAVLEIWPQFSALKDLIPHAWGELVAHAKREYQGPVSYEN